MEEFTRPPPQKLLSMVPTNLTTTKQKSKKAQSGVMEKSTPRKRSPQDRHHDWSGPQDKLEKANFARQINHTRHLLLVSQPQPPTPSTPEALFPL